MNEPLSTTQIAIHGFLALFGAITNAAKAHRNGTSKSFTDAMLITIMSTFSGVMFSLIGFHMFPDQQYLTMALAGTGGYWGVEGMAVIVEKIRKILNK